MQLIKKAFFEKSCSVLCPIKVNVIESFGHKMFISSQSKLCIQSNNFFDKSCSVLYLIKVNVIKSQD